MPLESWRDLAVILLALEAFVLALVPGVILFFMLRGLRWVDRKLRHSLPAARALAQRAALGSEKASQRIAAPFVAAGAAGAGARSLLAALAQRTPKEEV